VRDGGPREVGHIPHAMVILVQGQMLLRETLTASIAQVPDLEIMEVPEGRAALGPVRRAQPDVMVLVDDVAVDHPLLPREIHEAAIRSGVLLLVDQEDEHDLAIALDQGVRGYVGKDRTLDYFVAAIQAVARGELSIPTAMTLPVLDLVLRKRLGLDLGEHRFTSLTSREREVLYLLAKGRGTNGIASVMTISPQTVRTHVQNIFAKLEVRSRIAAVAFATQEDRMERLDSAMRDPGENANRAIFAGHCP